MAGALAQLAFDYGDMPASDSKALERHAENVLKIQERQRKTTAENVLKLGAELKAAQERLSNHGNGTFGKWCVERCGISRSSADKIIKSHEVFSDKVCVNFTQSFDASALYALSADTCPEAALADALKLAKKGEVITHKRAKEIIAEHTIEGEADESRDGAADSTDESGGSFDWQPADFVTATRKHVRQWVNACPPEDLHFIYETLRDLAAQLEGRVDDDRRDA